LRGIDVAFQGVQNSLFSLPPVNVTANAQGRSNSFFLSPASAADPDQHKDKADERSRLDSLTGLRFFASAAIVYLHISGSYGLKPSTFPLGNGVTLFFVLSGFILTHVYPSFSDSTAVWSFYRARFGRIWPLHFACFTLAVVLYIGVPSEIFPSFATRAVTNLFLLHAWVPTASFAWAFNGVSWTISVEAFFYAMFPLLIMNFQRDWYWKLTLAFGLVLLMAGVTSTLGVTSISPSAEISANTPTILNLLAINPLPRLLEFVTGMTCCLAWQKGGRLLPRSFIISSILEIGAVLFTWWIGYRVAIIASIGGFLFGDDFFLWMTLGGAMIPAAALLIVTLASGRGVVGRILASPPLIFLGEISFAIYMVHQIVETFLAARFNALAGLSTPLAISIYLCATFITSVALFYGVERPCRNWITGRRHLVGYSGPRFLA
jgi:peptidoglycan/LPS O-acetylase OafA/YrhL